MDCHQKLKVKFVTCIDRQRKVTENTKLFYDYYAKIDYFSPELHCMCSNIPQFLNYIVENDMNSELMSPQLAN